MSDNDSPPSRPPVEVPSTDRSSIATSPANPLDGTASEKEFDSNNNPDAERYLPTSFSRPPGPRKSTSAKSTPRNARQEFSASTSNTGTETTHTTPLNSPALSQDGSDHDEELPQRKKRPHSGHISHGSMTFDELAQRLAVVTDERNQLTKLKVKLERKSESDAAQIEQLQDTLNAARTARNSLMPRTVKAQKELADLQQTHEEILAKNAELEGQNKTWKREKAQAQSSEERCLLLNQSMVNQIEMLNETVFRNESRIHQLKEGNAILWRERDEAAAEANRARDDQSLLASWDESNQELRDENAILKREVEAVRIHMERMQKDQDGLEEDLWNLASLSASTAFAQGTWTRTASVQAPQERASIDNSGLTRLDSSVRNENPVKDPTCVDTEVQTSPREVFELMKPVTTVGEQAVILQPTTNVHTRVQTSTTENVDNGNGIVLSPTTYVNNATQTSMAETVDSTTQTTALYEDHTALPRPLIYVKAGTQKDPEHVEVWQNILSEDSTTFSTYVSRDKRQEGPLDTASENPAPSVSNMSREKKPGAFDWWPLKSDGKPVYKFVGPRSRDLHPEMYGSGEASPIPEVVVPSSDPMVRDFAFEKAENKDAQDTTVIELPSLPFDFRSQRSETFEKNASRSSQMQDAGTRTKEREVTFKLPYRLKIDFEQNAQRNEAKVTYTLAAVKAAWPIWYHVVLGLLMMVILTHSFFEEKSFWRDANELTRRAVLGMRDERWGSEWVEKIGYTLHRRLGVDRTGFC